VARCPGRPGGRISCLSSQRPPLPPTTADSYCSEAARVIGDRTGSAAPSAGPNCRPLPRPFSTPIVRAEKPDVVHCYRSLLATSVGGLAGSSRGARTVSCWRQPELGQPVDENGMVARCCVSLCGRWSVDASVVPPPTRLPFREFRKDPAKFVRESNRSSPSRLSAAPASMAKVSHSLPEPRRRRSRVAVVLTHAKPKGKSARGPVCTRRGAQARALLLRFEIAPVWQRLIQPIAPSYSDLILSSRGSTEAGIQLGTERVQGRWPVFSS